ncbi:MAG: HupE/UreJ family protein, partial [Rhodospirillaceae bacterium]
INCPLSEGELRIDGLQRTLTDVFVRITRLDAPEETAVLRPNASALDLSEPVPGTALAAYFRLGVEHILFGFDHLLFVLGLCLVVRPKQLIWTVTAFSIAHSLTLALSALAGITLPGPPVEAVIALSIILLAREALERLSGRETLASRKPWLIAFGFGLIHGFGFAGALSEIGLPKSQEVWALLLFNLGVEAGQILFVAFVFLVAAFIWRLASATRTPSRAFAAYFIGTAGTFWLIERLSSFPQT